MPWSSAKVLQKGMRNLNFTYKKILNYLNLVYVNEDFPSTWWTRAHAQSTGNDQESPLDKLRIKQLSTMARREQRSRDRYGTAEEEHEPGSRAQRTAYLLQAGSDESEEQEADGLMRNQHSRRTVNNSNYESDYDSDEDSQDGEYSMSLQELLYSSSSYYAIAKPVTLTMVLAALAVVFVNTDETREEGEEAMAGAYQVWKIDSAGSNGQALAMSFANALVMVSFICAMTFLIVILYRFRCMKCLIGYMMTCSCVLLGVLGGNLMQTAIHIYNVPVDKLSFFLFVFNFCIVGVISVFYGRGIPKFVTQGYLIATSVILAWHISYFDDWTAWTLLLMLALYDLCAVLTPCGPLKALVELMSQEEAPEMPGLLFEADLPPDVKRPGIPKTQTGLSQNSSRNQSEEESDDRPPSSRSARPVKANGNDTAELTDEDLTVNIPLAIAKVYNLPVISIPSGSKKILNPERDNDSNVSASPLLQEDVGVGDSAVSIPENPTPTQLRAMVTVRLPSHGGRIEQVSRRGKRVFLERDRHGDPKRILWVDRNGKVFAEMRSDDDEGPETNSIRLGLGDFIFYSVLVAKAAQYSFATFAACVLVILAGLGSTLVLLSVYHHALPALPISIILGVVFYLMTRTFIEPWIEVVLSKPFYV